MKYNDFTFDAGRILLWRLGNMNSNKQSHWGDRVRRQPPTKRGIWCFPYPHYDLFFCWHQWEKHLPVKFQKYGQIGSKNQKEHDFDEMTDSEAEAYWKEREERLKDIRKKFRPTTFWYKGEFYSHIDHNGKTGKYNEWYWWDTPRLWAKEAEKHLSTWDRFGDMLFKINYAKDHLELFIPNY